MGHRKLLSYNVTLRHTEWSMVSSPKVVSVRVRIIKIIVTGIIVQLEKVVLRERDHNSDFAGMQRNLKKKKKKRRKEGKM